VRPPGLGSKRADARCCSPGTHGVMTAFYVGAHSMHLPATASHSLPAAHKRPVGCFCGGGGRGGEAEGAPSRRPN